VHIPERGMRAVILVSDVGVGEYGVEEGREGWTREKERRPAALLWACDLHILSLFASLRFYLLKSKARMHARLSMSAEAR